MVYSEVTSTTSAVFNCPPLGYSSANGPFLPNQPPFFPPTPMTNGYNLPRNPVQLPMDHFNAYNNQYGRPNYPIQEPNDFVSIFEFWLIFQANLADSTNARKRKSNGSTFG
jgi:hypothetical protein